MPADPFDLVPRRAAPARAIARGPLAPRAAVAAMSARRRDAAALRFVEELFALHHDGIHAYLARMLRDPELAADLTQETFLRAHRAQATLTDRASARGWLYRIAHRAAIDELRRRRIVRFVPLAGEARTTAPSAEQLVLDGRLSGELERALAAIPERQRAALLLAELHDLTGSELAEALGVRHDAARALLARARASLRRALAAEREAAHAGPGGRSEEARP